MRKINRNLIICSLVLGAYFTPVKEENIIVGRYLIGNKFVQERYFIEKVLQGEPISYIKINPFDFKINEIEMGDILTLENIVLKNLFGGIIRKRANAKLQKNPFKYF